MNDLHTPVTAKQALYLRLATGGVFGLIIAALTKIGGVTDVGQWRETLAGTFALVAFVIWAGAGSMRRTSLAVWTAIAAALIGYILWTGFDKSARGSDTLLGHYFLILPLLFIAHELVSSGDQAGKPIAPYETYFDEAWKRGVQLALSIAFTLLFWGILWLGAALLGFIGFDWLKRLLQNEYFSLPMLGLAFGAAVHLADVQTKLLADVRNLILGVLSWLLPVITIIGAIFAGSLAFSGLAPLWATKAATATLLSGCVGFVLLINAAYQQGDVERRVPMVLKWCVRGAAVLLLIFSVLAAWSLGLRIGQYGLSPDRVFAGLGVIIALMYGTGYSFAAFVPGRWMAMVETLNIYFAMFKCLLLVAILTPLAAPNRLSVNDQVARLNSGKVSVADFDWWLLKDETGSYGKKALTALAASSNPSIATKAKDAVDNKISERPRRNREEQVEPTATRADIEAIQVIFPADGKLPDNFIKTNLLTPVELRDRPSCLRIPPSDGGLSSCKIALLDLNEDGSAEILIREGPSLRIYTFVDGLWTSNTGYIDIGSLEEAFDAGKLRAAPSKWNDLMIGEERRSFTLGQTGPDSIQAAAAAADAAVDEAAKSASDEPKAPSK
jgi:Domain of unknown function (DUF4153)